MTEYNNYTNKDGTYSYYSAVTSSYVKAVRKPLPPTLYPFERIEFFTGAYGSRTVTKADGSTVTSTRALNSTQVWPGRLSFVSGSRFVYNSVFSVYANMLIVVDKTGDTWQPQIELTGTWIDDYWSNPYSYTHQGSDMMRVHKNKIIIGHPTEKPGYGYYRTYPEGNTYVQGRGSVYIFASASGGARGDGAGWVRTRFFIEDLFTSSVGSGVAFGASCFINDQILAVGSPFECSEITLGPFQNTGRSFNHSTTDNYWGAQYGTSDGGGVWIYDVRNEDFLSSNDGTGSFPGGWSDPNSRLVQYITCSFRHWDDSFPVAMPSGMNKAYYDQFGDCIGFNEKHQHLIIGGYGFVEIFKSSSAEGWHWLQHLYGPEFCAYQSYGNKFGKSINSVDDWLIIGAPNDRPEKAGLTSGNLTCRGSATIFKWDANQAQYVRHTAFSSSTLSHYNNNGGCIEFGNQVAISSCSFGLYCAVAGGGQRGGNGIPYEQSGSVQLYKYNYDGDIWKSTAGNQEEFRLLTGSPGTAPYQPEFGTSLSMWASGSEMHLLVGAPNMARWDTDATINFAARSDSACQGVMNLYQVSQSQDYVTEIVGDIPPTKLASKGAFNLRGQSTTNQTGINLHRTFIGN